MEARRAAILAAPGFGRHFAERMLVATHSEERGWSPLEDRPFGDFPLSPDSAVLHYGQAVFEGLKAYAQPDGSVALFRPEANAERLRRAARRVALPEVPVPEFVAACERIVALNRAWVPRDSGKSLYVRPIQYAADEGLAPPASRTCHFVVLASPVSPFFSDDIRPVKVWVSRDLVRAVEGGTGDVKCGANYAAGMLPKDLARRRGCGDVLFLDARERRYIEELSAMNVFFLETGTAGPRLLTPALSGTILPGVTRDSLLVLGRRAGLEVAEERLELDRVVDGLRSGRITEAFAAGTAAVVAPIGTLQVDDEPVQVADGTPGVWTMRLREALLDIQEGRAADEDGWRHTLP